MKYKVELELTDELESEDEYSPVSIAMDIANALSELDFGIDYKEIKISKIE